MTNTRTINHGVRPAWTLKRVGALSLIAGSVLVLGAPPALAGPEGARVVQGQANIQRQGGLTTITAGNNAIINYRSFDVHAGETVRFVQPVATSRVLNRVQSALPTRIDGSLAANGRVYIVNPAGVIFGAGSVVNVSGLVAAAANIRDRDFVRGVDHFTGVAGEVRVQGVINASSVTLLGKQVFNEGNIVADGGLVTFASGDDIMVREQGGAVSVKIDARPVDASPASKGGVSLGAGDVLGVAVHNTGSVRVGSGSFQAGTQKGEVRNDGTIDASVASGHAGSIAMAGPAVTNAGTLTASAATGQAGTVNVTSVTRTELTSGSTINASGGGIASGGSVLVHAYHGDTVVQRGATVNISGGVQGGNGGIAEISAAHNLRIEGTLIGNAVAGAKPASILFDPVDITIFDPGPGSNADGEVADGVVLEGDGGQVGFFISPSAIESFQGDVRLEASNDIVFLQDVNKTNGGLTLRAGRDISFAQDPLRKGNDSISVTATFLDFEAGRNISDFVFSGARLTATSGDIRTVATAGDVRFGLASVPAGRTIFLTQAQSKFVGAGPDGFIANPDTTRLVIDITNGFLIFGGDFGAAQGFQNILSVDARASQYLRVEDNLNLGEFATLRSNDEVQIAGTIRAGQSISLRSGLDGSGNLRFEPHLDVSSGELVRADLGAGSITLAAGSGTGLGVARVDVLTNAPVLRGSGLGESRPNSLAFEQDAPITSADLPRLSQFGAAIGGLTYRIESFDNAVTVDDASLVNGTLLTLVSPLQSRVDAPIDVVSLDVFGPALLRADVTSSADQTYHGTVIFENDRTLSGATVRFLDAADALVAFGAQSPEGAGPTNLVINGNLDLQATLGAINGLQSLIVNGNSRLGGGLVRAAGDERFNGNVVLGANTELVSFEGGLSGVIRFGGTVDGGFDLAASTTPEGLIAFAGDVGVESALRDITLSTRGGASARSIPDKATVVGEGSLAIRARDFIMGQNEKFTTLGSVDINASRAASLGDMTAVGDLRVTSPTITLLLREAATLLDASGASVSDRGLDFVAGGQLSLAGDVTLGGTGSLAPTFADATGNAPANLSGYEFTQSLATETSAEALRLNGRVLDQRTRAPAPPPPPPPPPPVSDVSDGLRGATEFPPLFEDTVRVRVFDLRLLARVLVPGRNVAASEALGGLAGPLVYDDLVEASQNPTVVAATRFDIQGVMRVVNRYNATFGSPDQDQTPQVAADLNAGVQQWLTLSGATTFDPGAFRAFAQSDQADAAIRQRIAQLEGVLGALRGLGLTSTEYRLARARVLEPLASLGVGVEDLAAAIDPPVSGS